MIKKDTALAVVASLIALAAWQTGGADQKPARAGKLPDTETLQKATTLAVGNLAWESVKISDVQRNAVTVEWLAGRLDDFRVPERWQLGYTTYSLGR